MWAAQASLFSSVAYLTLSSLASSTQARHRTDKLNSPAVSKQSAHLQHSGSYTTQTCILYTMVSACIHTHIDYRHTRCTCVNMATQTYTYKSIYNTYILWKRACMHNVPKYMQKDRQSGRHPDTHANTYTSNSGSFIS